MPRQTTKAVDRDDAKLYTKGKGGIVGISSGIITNRIKITKV